MVMRHAIVHGLFFGAAANRNRLVAATRLF
jgi:hypothetical protein